MSDYDAFQGKLLSGERITWAGRPRQGLMLSLRDLFLVPVSLFWCAVVTGFGQDTDFLTRQSGIGTLFLVVFMAAGVYFTVGRFFHDAWLRSRMHYALTDRRALILKGQNLIAVDLARVDAVRLSGGATGERGTVSFGADPGLATWFGRRNSLSAWLPSVGDPPRFIGIDDAQSVFNRVEIIRAKAA